jgi:uncharacterized protein (TIGR02246 family)
MSDFAYLSSPIKFVITNVSSNGKTIRVFNQKIKHNESYDLMAIPGVGEAEITDSLLKGELKSRLANGQITITNNTTSIEVKDRVYSETLSNRGFKDAKDQQVANDHAMLYEIFATIDAKDAAGVASVFTDDGVQTFQNFAPWVGKSGIQAANAGFFTTIQGLSHNIISIEAGEWNGNQRVYAVHAEATYHRWNGSYSPPIPVYSVLRFEGDLVKDYQIYGNTAKLYVG